MKLIKAYLLLAYLFVIFVIKHNNHAAQLYHRQQKGNIRINCSKNNLQLQNIQLCIIINNSINSRLNKNEAYLNKTYNNAYQYLFQCYCGRKDEHQHISIKNKSQKLNYIIYKQARMSIYKHLTYIFVLNIYYYLSLKVYRAYNYYIVAFKKYSNMIYLWHSVHNVVLRDSINIVIDLIKDTLQEINQSQNKSQAGTIGKKQNDFKLFLYQLIGINDETVLVQSIESEQDECDKQGQEQQFSNNRISIPIQEKYKYLSIDNKQSKSQQNKPYILINQQIQSQKQKLDQNQSSFQDFDNDFYYRNINRYEIQIQEIVQKQICLEQIQQYEDQDYNSRWFQKTIGLLVTIWRNKDNKVIYRFIGTAFAIDKTRIVTCAHNIYHENASTQCTQFMFIPNVHNSRIQHKDIYKNRKYQFILYQKLQQGQTFGCRPLKNDYAILILEKQLPFQQFLPFANRQIEPNQELQILGFSAKQLNQKIEVGAYIKREDLQGRLLQINDYIIKHSLCTSNGHSGSPIICKTYTNKKCRYEVCGIHSHRGNNKYNQGILIDDQNIKWLKKLNRLL